MDTPEARYEQLTDDVIELYEQGRQRDALELLHAADPDLAPWTAELAHTEACVYGSLGEPEAALRVLGRRRRGQLVARADPDRGRRPRCAPRTPGVRGGPASRLEAGLPSTGP